MVAISDLVGRQDLKCYDVCREVYRRLGKHLPEVSLLYPEKYKDLIELHRHLFVKLSKPEAFCLVLFNTDPPHIGVAIDEFRVIHASRTHGVIVSQINYDKVEGFYALRSRS